MKAFAIFGNHAKAIEMGISRFDEQTKADMLKLYEKISGERATATMEEVIDLSQSARVNLNVPYAAKEEAKAYGAKWDDVERTWYTTGENYAQHKDFFDGYNPPHHRRTPMPAHGNLTIVQGEPDLPDFDIELIEDLDADLLNDPCLGGSEF